MERSCSSVHRSPDELAEDDVRRYLLHLKLDKKSARSSFSVVLGGLRFFYQQALGRDWKSLYVAKPRSEKKLPVVLSREEVWRVLDAVRIDVYQPPQVPRAWLPTSEDRPQ